VHATYTAGRHEPDPGQPARRQRPADRGRAELSLYHAGRDIARADLPRRAAGLGEALQRCRIQADPDGAIGDADGGWHGARGPDAVLRLARHGEAASPGETVRHQRGLQRDDRPACR
jgi:hypothetical protein